MKTLIAAILTLVLVLAGIGVSGAAPSRHGGYVSAGVHSGGHARVGVHRGGHARVGVFIGVPLFYGSAYYPYYAPPYYHPPYYPPTVVSSPPVYIEQGTTQASPAQGALPEGWWYYCSESRAYYPYVKECPGDWQRVPPRPPNG